MTGQPNKKTARKGPGTRKTAAKGRSKEKAVDNSIWVRNLLETSPDLVCLCEKGKIAYINPAGLATLGLKSLARATGRPFSDFMHPDNRGMVSKLLKSGNTGTQPLPLKLKRGRNTFIDAEFTFRVTGAKGDGLVNVQARDITDKFRAAKEVLGSETRYRHLVESALDMICVCDQGVITYINQAGAAMLREKKPESLVGRRLVTIVHPDYREAISNGLSELSDELNTLSGSGSTLPLKFVRVDGELIDVEIAIMPFGDPGEDSYMLEVRDITDRKRAKEELRKAHNELEDRVEKRTRELTQQILERHKAEEKLRLAAEVIANLTEAVIIVDRKFKVLDANPAYTEITGFREKDFLGNIPSFYKALKKDTELHQHMQQDLGSKGYWKGEFWDKNKSGKEYALRLSISAIFGDKEADTQYAIVLNDITKRKQDQERIYQQANYDTLTGLPNRALFHDRLDLGLSTMNRSNRKLGLMFIDLDGFKLVNDTLGHDIGDLMLKEAAKRLKKCIRKGDTVARLGGDEFTVIMPNLLDPRHAPLLAQRILDTLAKPFQLNDHESFISGSIGVTIYPDDGTEAYELIKNADSAMYRAKDQGKANYQFFTADLNAQVKERLVLKNGLSKALAGNEFSLFYQPKLEISSGRITGVEALMRWNNDELGSISPVKFVPVLEETGMVVEVGEWALRTACAQHKDWIEKGLPPIRIAVNLSARQLREKSFIPMLKSVMKETGVTAASLEIEITESMLMLDSEGAVVALNTLNKMGFHVAMDDFGTGYSSLSYLKMFPIDTIKIDRSFVSDITTSEDDAEIIKTIISMGQTLNRRVIAEGVETEEQLALLKKYKCDEIQGYYFCVPLPSDEVTIFLYAHFSEARAKAVNSSS